MKILGGCSTTDSISFSSRFAKVVIHNNGVCEFASYVENGVIPDYDEKKKKSLKDLKYPFGKKVIIGTIIEICFMLLDNLLGMKNLAILFGAMGLAISLYYVIRAIMHFTSLPSLRRNHGAEHAVYNVVNKKEDFTAEDLRNASTYCVHCGSVKPINFLFFTIINLVLSILFHVWIPISLLLCFTFNYNRTFIGNFLARIYQKFLTLKPSDKELALSYTCYKTLLYVDAYIGLGGEMTPSTFTILANSAAESAKDFFKR